MRGTLKMCNMIMLAAAMLVATASVASADKQPRRGLPFYGAPDMEGALRKSQADASPQEVTAGSRSEGFNSIMSTCGTKNDWQDVELYNGQAPPLRFVSAHQPAVAQIQWKSAMPASLSGRQLEAGNVAGQRWCSGTLIAASLFLTAAHCFEPQDDAQGWKTPRYKSQGGAKATILSAAELAPLMQLNFRYQVDGNDQTGRIRAAEVFPIVRLVEYGFGNKTQPLDYAVVEVGPDASGRLPGAAYGVTQTDSTPQALTNAQLLVVIQHPHGAPKKVMAGPKAGLDGGILLYNDLDTLGGSSGSGVLDHRGRLIAVHIEGGCTEFGGANRGLTLREIKKVSSIVK